MGRGDIRISDLPRTAGLGADDFPFSDVPRNECQAVKVHRIGGGSTLDGPHDR